MFKILTLSLAIAVCNAKYLPMASEIEPIAVMPSVPSILSLPVKEILAEPESKPTPYSFGYETLDDYGTKQVREESGDGAGNVKGFYSYSNAQGLMRRVEYVADAYGYRATVTSNEPGVQKSNPADVVLNGPAVAYAENKSKN